MSGLADFITARLDEDEAMAQRNTEPHGLGDDGNPDHGCGYPDYIRHFRPLRELREVTAKRRLIGRYRAALAARAADDDPPDYDPVLAALHGQMRDEAAVYSDHGDYRAEWQPAL